MRPPTTDLREIRGGLAWTLAVDLCGTAALGVTAVVMNTAYYQALALVAVAGAALAVVSVTVAAGTLGHSAPSRRALVVSATTAALGLAVNTAGVMWVLNMRHAGHFGAAMLLLLMGDALGVIYLLLIHRALVATRSVG